MFEHITASEVAGYGVGALLLCATISAPKIDSLISSSQRRRALCTFGQTTNEGLEGRCRKILLLPKLLHWSTFTVKTRLQAQAAGVPYHGLCRTACFETNTMLPDMRCYPSCTRAVIGSESTCAPDCLRYKGTFDVFYKVMHQEGFARLWRGTYASLALAVPTVGIYLPCYDIFRNFLEEFTSRNAPSMIPYVPLVAGSVARSLACITCYPVELARTRMQAFKETQIGVKPPGVLKTLVGVISPVKSTNHLQTSVQNYCSLWAGLDSQIARDVPFSAICWSTLEPKDPSRSLKMTTKQTSVEIWRDGGIKGRLLVLVLVLVVPVPLLELLSVFTKQSNMRYPSRDQEDLHHTSRGRD